MSVLFSKRLVNCNFIILIIFLIRVLCDNVKITGNNGFKLKGVIYPAPKPLNNNLNTENALNNSNKALSTNSNNIAQGSLDNLAGPVSTVNVNKRYLPTLLFEFPSKNVYGDGNSFLNVPEKESFYIFIISISVFIMSLIVTGYLIYSTAHLFSKGFYSTKFYRGGGTLILVTAIEGLAAGLFLGWIVKHNLEIAVGVAGPFMCIFVSVILIGTRGLVLGGFGGCTLGFIIGNMINQSPKINVITPLIGLICGLLIGMLPIFPTLKINQRYSRKLVLERDNRN